MDPAKASAIADEPMIFGLLLIISNRMSTQLDRELAEFGVTARQWFLSETIRSLFEEPPTLMELASAMGTSYQNVKQIALKLQQKGLLRLVRDRADARVTRVRLAERSEAFWRGTDPKGALFRERLYRGVDSQDLEAARAVLERMLRNLAEIEVLAGEAGARGRSRPGSQSHLQLN